MNVTIDTLKDTIHKLNYVWYFDRPNIIGVRTALDAPDIFNDLLCMVYFENGIEKLKIYPVTTDPGVYYQKHLLNKKGCLVMKLGQYVDAYSLGFHQGKPTHEALIQVGEINVIRDKDLDGIAGNSGIEERGCFGANIHGANNNTVTKTIGPWSAGCQVHAVWSNKEEMIAICKTFKTVTKNKFTYTLIGENQL